MAHQTGRGEEQATQGVKRKPEADYVETEHDPAASRRTSDAAIQRMLGPRIQRKAATAAEPSMDSAGVQRAASQSGAPLPANLRGRFEGSLGTELSGVRVHTSSASAAAADGLGAKAYTTGQDIHFAAGQYDPASKEGQHLLAHEVAHTVQQGGSRAAPQAKLEVSGPADSHEHEADQAADAMIVGRPALVSSSSASSDVQRKSSDGTSAQGETGVVASDFASSPDVGGMVPDRRNLKQGYRIGHDHIDDGAACEAAPQGTGCFLSEKQRDRLIRDIGLLMADVKTNYKLAIVDLKITELLKKEEDLSWVVSLALDLAGAHLITVLGSALKAVQGSAAAKLAQMQLDAGAAGQYSASSWTSRAEAAIELASSTRIDAVVRSGLGVVTPKAKTVGKAAQNHATETQKAESIGYLDQLRDSCDIAFGSFYRTIAGEIQDAELVVVYWGLQPEHHTVGAYVKSLKAKVDRFLASGVTDIGRKEVKADDYGGKEIRDTRVVYVQDIDGRKVAWYQRADGDYSPGLASPGDPLYEQLDPKNPAHQQPWGQFGPRHAGRAELDRPVPEEFREIAIARSEARWGATPTIDDGYVATLKQQGLNVDEMRMKLRGSPVVKSQSNASPLPAGSVFAEPNAQLNAGSLPPGSIFADEGKKS